MATTEQRSESVRALAPEPFDAFDAVVARLRMSGPTRSLELSRRRIGTLLDGEVDALPILHDLPADHIESLSNWPTSLHFDAVERATLELAEQFVLDVAGVSDDQRQRCLGDLGDQAFVTVQGIYVLDHGLRIRAALRQVFGVGGVVVPTTPASARTDRADRTEHADAADPAGLWAALDDWMRAVARLDVVDPVTTELVRLRGARTHDCRLCRSRRFVRAVRQGADESLFDQVDDYEHSSLSERHKTALRLTDAMLWRPTAYPAGLVQDVHARFSAAEALELVLDIARNAANKIAVTFGADQPHVADGLEYFDLDDAGELHYGLDPGREFRHG